MLWFKWYNGTADDPKFACVARRSNRSLSEVIAIWSMLLEHANNDIERGCILKFDCECADVRLGLEDGATQKILDAMQAKGLICDGYITNWNKRQNSRTKQQSDQEQQSDGSVNASTLRSRRYREKQRNADATLCNAAEENRIDLDQNRVDLYDKSAQITQGDLDPPGREEIPHDKSFIITGF